VPLTNDLFQIGESGTFSRLLTPPQLTAFLSCAYMRIVDMRDKLQVHSCRLPLLGIPIFQVQFGSLCRFDPE
jgi:hypothetical protein